MARWSGPKDSGGPGYRPEELVKVCRFIERCTSPESAKAVEQISRDTRLGSRTVRAILSECDGVNFVLAYTEHGECYLAQHAEEAEAYTVKLLGQIRTMEKRVRRRQEYTKRLPRQQAVLW